MIIEVCVYRKRTRIHMHGVYRSAICTRFRCSFVALHRNLFYGLPPHFPQELFGYVFPANYKQWLSLNRCKRAQRTQPLRFLFLRVSMDEEPYLRLHQRLQLQIDRECLWKGRRYRTSCWDSRADIFTVLCDLLT